LARKTSTAEKDDSRPFQFFQFFQTLCLDGILELVESGDEHKVNRYWYLAD